MKILCVIDSLGSGGAQRQIVNLAIGLKKRGHDVHVFIYHPHLIFFKKDLDIFQIPLHSYNKKRVGFSFELVGSLRRLIKKNRFNIAISFLEGPNIYLILASFGLGINSIVSERSSYFEAKNQWVYILKKQLYRLANFVVSNSETQSDWLVKTAKLPSKKVVTINNGFEVEQYFPTLKIPKFPQEIALIAIGRVTPVKNLLVVIEGLNHFYSNYHWIPTITWVGRCESGAYQSQIKKVLSQFPIVELHWKWAQEQDDIPKLIQAYHALILPSLYEGFPNVVCEALLSGRPVLVSDVCDNPRIVQEGVMGFKFNPNSPEALSDALHKLTVLSPDEWKEMSQSARAYAEKSLSIDLLINKFSTLF